MATQAKRLNGHAELHGEGFDDSIVCYWKGSDGVWMVYLPKCGAGRIPLHTVVEHADGTITVSPSIKMWGHDNGQETVRHGYLEKGMWRDV